MYSSFGLENYSCTYLSQVTSSFSSQEKIVIIQMDKIHVKSDILYKGGKIFGPNLSPENPTRTGIQTFRDRTFRYKTFRDGHFVTGHFVTWTLRDKTFRDMDLS